MFPINPLTFFYLSLIGIFLSSTLAMGFSRRWRIPLLLVAISLPAALLWPNPPTGEYAGLAYILVIGPSIITMVFGIICGSNLRRLHIAPWTVGVIASAAAAFVLWHQYVPNACLGAPLQVRIAGSILFVPSEMQPRVEDGDSVNFFGRTDRKSSYARLCRIGHNGTRPIEVDTVWITPASNHTEMTATCNGSGSPVWCKAYSPDPYRRIGKVLIAPASQSGFPRSYWDSGSSRYNKQGDLTEGSICLMSNVTQCWTWRPFGHDSRLIVSTNNLDETFTNMPVEEARDMIVKTRDMTLAIISPVTN
jgi:hypothetical protein